MINTIQKTILLLIYRITCKRGEKTVFRFDLSMKMSKEIVGVTTNVYGSNLLNFVNKSLSR